MDIKIPEIVIPEIVIPKMDYRTPEQIEKEIQEVPDMTDQCTEEVGEQLKKIKEFEKKLKDDLKFDMDGRYYFSIVFKSNEERTLFLEKNHVKLILDDHVIYDEIKQIFKEG